MKITASPRCLLITSDSESSEEEDRKVKKKEGKEKHQAAEEEEQEERVKGKQGVKRRKSRLTLHTSVQEPLHLYQAKPRRESMRTMKLYRDSGERLHTYFFFCSFLNNTAHAIDSSTEFTL